MVSSKASEAVVYDEEDPDVLRVVGTGSEAHARAPVTVEELSKIALVIATYFFISIALIFFNKLIMTPQTFPFPLTVSWVQFAVALVCIIFFRKIGEEIAPSLSFLPPLSFNMSIAVKVAPVTGIFVAMIVFNNLCLQYVEVSFYQVARAWTTILTIAFAYFLLNESTSVRALIACGVVVVGFVLGSWGEVNLSWTGVTFGMVSSIFVALYSIYVKKAIVLLDGDQWMLLIYNTILALIVLIPLIAASGEIPLIMEQPNATDGNTWFLIILAGVLGFAINIVVYLLLKLTSPLTHNITGQLKGAVQTILAFYLFQNPVTIMNAVGIGLIIAGSMMYSYVRYREMK